MRWHRRGWRFYWRWRSGHQLGRPRLSPEVGELRNQIQPVDLPSYRLAFEAGTMATRTAVLASKSSALSSESFEAAKKSLSRYRAEATRTRSTTRIWPTFAMRFARRSTEEHRCC